MTNSNHRVTIKDVARAAGVSEQTVSRTVHDSPAVKVETKERVRTVMRELGYRPSFAGLSLRRGRYHAIGLVMPNITSAGNLDRLDGIATAAERNGYAITLIKTGEADSATLSSAAERMAALPVDGMIFTLNRMAADFYDYVPPNGLNTVIVTMKEHPHCSTVDNDQHRGSERVVKYFLERGHKTVHHIAGPLRSLSGQQREEGWRRALAEHNIEPPKVIRGDWTPESGYRAGLELAKDPSVTAIYASDDAMAYGCMRALQDRGRSIPDDVSIIGVDNILGTIVPHSQLTSLSFDNAQVGRWAVDKLTEANGLSSEREHVLFQGSIIERQSVRDLR